MITRTAVLLAAITLTLTSCSNDKADKPTAEPTASEPTTASTTAPVPTRKEKVRETLSVGLVYQLNRLANGEPGARQETQKVICLSLLNGSNRETLIELIKESGSEIRGVNTLVDTAMKNECQPKTNA